MRLKHISKVFVTKLDQIQENDILLMRVGSSKSVVRPLIAGKDTSDLPRNTITIRLNPDQQYFDPHYLCYWFQMVHGQGFFKAMSQGTCQQFIRRRDIANIQITGG